MMSPERGWRTCPARYGWSARVIASDSVKPEGWSERRWPRRISRVQRARLTKAKECWVANIPSQRMVRESISLGDMLKPPWCLCDPHGREFPQFSLPGVGLHRILRGSLVPRGNRETRRARHANALRLPGRGPFDDTY